MDDMYAFERQVAARLQQHAGPVGPVNDLAIFESVVAGSRSQRRGTTVFSALRLVAAAAVVVLFGGLVLAGVLTQPSGEPAPAAVTESPRPMTTEEMLSAVSTEEVGPGMLRIIDDGVRDPTTVDAVDIMAGYDGGIWLLRKDGFLRLGSDGPHVWPPGTGPEDHVLEVAPDGTLWVIPVDPSERRPVLYHQTGRRSAEDSEWAVQPCPGPCPGVTLTHDGTVWASWVDGDGRWRVGYLGATGWQPLDGYARTASSYFDGFDRLHLTDAGDLYGFEDDAYTNALYRYDDGAWDQVSDAYELIDVGRDGTVWQDGGVGSYPGPSPAAGLFPAPGTLPGDGLARLDGAGWTVWEPAELPDIRFSFALDSQFEVAPDGSLWFSLWPGVDSTGPRRAEHPRWEERAAEVERGRLACDGLGHFDGETLDRFLPGRCVSIDIAADGSAWVLADKEEGQDLYVITPEAVATSR